MLTARERLKYWWNNSPDPAVGYARQRLDPNLPEPIRSSVEDDPQSFSLSYAGYASGEVNILQLLERLRSKTSPGHVARSTDDDTPADIDLHGSPSLTPGPSTGIELPFRIHLVVDTPDPSTVRRNMSKRERSNFNKTLRDSGVSFTVTTDPAQVSRFYHSMHVPTMATRHAEQARSDSESGAQDLARRGGLFLMSRDGEDVAGCLFTLHEGVVTTRLLGVLGGRDDLYDDGSFKSLYFGMLDKWSKDPAVHAVDLFGTEAFMSKGIFVWKRKLGARVAPCPNHFRYKSLFMRVNNPSPAVRDFLVTNPFIIKHRSELRPVHLYDDGADAPPPNPRVAGLGEPIACPVSEFLALYGLADRRHHDAPDGHQPPTRGDHT